MGSRYIYHLFVICFSRVEILSCRFRICSMQCESRAVQSLNRSALNGLDVRLLAGSATAHRVNHVYLICIGPVSTVTGLNIYRVDTTMSHFFFTHLFKKCQADLFGCGKKMGSHQNSGKQDRYGKGHNFYFVWLISNRAL